MMTDRNNTPGGPVVESYRGHRITATIAGARIERPNGETVKVANYAEAIRWVDRFWESLQP